MKTTIAAASFALIAALSGLSTAHAAGFNDRSAIPDAASVQTGRQDLRHVPVVHGSTSKATLLLLRLNPRPARAATPWRSARTATWPRASASITARRSRVAEPATIAGHRGSRATPSMVPIIFAAAVRNAQPIRLIPNERNSISVQPLLLR
jgi:hypothetical protein